MKKYKKLLSNLNILICINNIMFCNMLSKLFSKKEKKIDIEDKKEALENT